MATEYCNYENALCQIFLGGDEMCLCAPAIEEGRAAIKSSLKNWLFSFYVPARSLPISFKVQLLETSPQKPPNKFGSLKILCLFFLMSFHFLYILNIIQYLNHES